LVRRSGLASSSVHAALNRLEASVIDRFGIGRIHLYRIRTEHPLTYVLGSLFAAERDRLT